MAPRRGSERKRGPRRCNGALGSFAPHTSSGASRDAKIVQVVTNDSSAELGVDETRHASEEASTAPLLQREDIREGAEQLAICGRAVFSSAEVTSVGDVRELWDCQVNARARQVFGSDLSERGIVVRIPAGVTGLARREERIIALGHTVP